jgi:hypothetical protein
MASGRKQPEKVQCCPLLSILNAFGTSKTTHCIGFSMTARQSANTGPFSSDLAMIAPHNILSTIFDFDVLQFVLRT